MPSLPVLKVCFKGARRGREGESGDAPAALPETAANNPEAQSRAVEQAAALARSRRFAQRASIGERAKNREGGAIRVNRRVGEGGQDWSDGATGTPFFASEQKNAGRVVGAARCERKKRKKREARRASASRRKVDEEARLSKRPPLRPALQTPA